MSPLSASNARCNLRQPGRDLAPCFSSSHCQRRRLRAQYCRRGREWPLPSEFCDTPACRQIAMSVLVGSMSYDRGRRAPVPSVAALMSESLQFAAAAGRTPGPASEQSGSPDRNSVAGHHASSASAPARMIALLALSTVSGSRAGEGQPHIPTSSPACTSSCRYDDGGQRCV